MSWFIAHSAKGSEWDEKNRKYLKREGTPGKMEDTGKYYYPDSYKGGRHLPKGDPARKNKETEHAHEYGDDMQDWEKKVHDHLASIIQKNPDMFKDTASVVNGIMDDKNLDAVKGTLKAFGVNADKMSDAEVKQLRQKIADFYTKNDKAVEEARSGKKVKSSEKEKKDDDTKKKKKSSSKKSSNKKSAPTPVAPASAPAKTGGGSAGGKSKTTAVSKSVYEGGTTNEIKRRAAKKRREAAKNSRYEGGYNGKNKKSISHSVDFVFDDYLEHHGILGQKWGVRRFQNKDGSRTAAGKKRESTLKNQIVRNSGSRKSDTLSKARKEDINKLSDEQLKNYNKRLQNEKQFAELTQGSMSSGKKFALNMATNITSAIITGIAIEAGRRFIKSRLGV